jgi:hypothetical protein
VQVTCQICRKKIERDAAYKRVVGKVNKYYCSADEFEAEEARKKKYKEDKDKVYYLICDMFGYDIQNTKFFDEWALWNKLQSNEIIYKYLRENEDYLQQICDRSFDTEYQKIRYFSAILKNSLRDFVPKVKVMEKPKVVVEETIYETPTHSLNKRRSLEDLEDMF